MLSDEMRETLSDVGLLILRLGCAVPLILYHGYPKIANYSAILADGFFDPLGLGEPTSLTLAIVAELFGSILIILGLATRFAALLVAFTFAVIVFIVQAGKPLGEVERAFLFGVCSLALVFTGPGRISLDAVIEFIRRD